MSAPLDYPLMAPLQKAKGEVGRLTKYFRTVFQDYPTLIPQGKGRATLPLSNCYRHLKPSGLFYRSPLYGLGTQEEMPRWEVLLNLLLFNFHPSPVRISPDVVIVGARHNDNPETRTIEAGIHQSHLHNFLWNVDPVQQ